MRIILYIAPTFFEAIVSPSSSSYHQHFLKTYNNKIGHNKHTYVAVGVVWVSLIHHNVRNKQRTKHSVNVKFRSNNFSLWTSVTLISAYTEASASKSGVFLARLALKLCVTWVFEVTKVQGKIVYEEQALTLSPGHRKHLVFLVSTLRDDSQQ
jgi:zinc transporter ZupT